MTHLFHLDSSVRAEGSRSRKLSAHYAERWRAANPDGSVTYRDLSADPIPHLDVAAVSMDWDTERRNADQAAARVLSEQLAGEVLSADTVLIGMPLYNFGPPSTFKAWLDRMAVRGLTIGALGDKEFVVVTARGGGMARVRLEKVGTTESLGFGTCLRCWASTTRFSSKRS